VLGVRDVAAEAVQVRRAWSSEGAYELLDDVYDLILVYGQQDVYDLAEQAGLSSRAAAKVRYVGYLRREVGPRSPSEVRASLGLKTDRLVLVTVGGGGDGYPLLAAMAEALRPGAPTADFDCVLVGGPLLPAADRQRLRAMLPDDERVRLLDVVDDLRPYVAAADVVVARGGYNTVCEILSFARPAVLAPRAPIGGSGRITEQLIRARALAERGLVRMIHPDELTPARLLQEVNGLLNAPAPPPAAVSLDGLPAVADELAALLGW
jgi:predicted glycosyltransferase